MFKTRLAIIATLILSITIPSIAVETNVTLPMFPSISPDGKTVVFSYHGDLWKVPTAGGTAIKLTHHSADEYRSTWSPDGTQIAFNSRRGGFLNIFTMNADGTNIQQVTHDDQYYVISGWGKDQNGESVITFYARDEAEIYRETKSYAVPVKQGIPQPVHGAFGSRPIYSPSGRQVLFTRGNSSNYRRHYRGPDNRNLWLYDTADNSFKQLTQWNGNDDYGKWINDTEMLFLSDREDNAVNLYRMKLNGNNATFFRVTSFKDKDIYDFDVSQDGKTAVLHVWNQLYRLDLTKPDQQAQPIEIRATEDANDRYELKSVNRSVSQAALSPDGKVMATVAYGDIFIRNVESGSPTQQITATPHRESDIAWSPDGLKLYFVSDQSGKEAIYAATVDLTRSEIKEEFKTLTEEKEKAKEESKDEVEKENDNEDKDKQKKEDSEEAKDKNKPERWHDAVRFKIETVIELEKNVAYNPHPSPDGKKLAYQQHRGDVVIYDLETKQSKTLIKGWDTWVEWTWSPDSKIIAYAQLDINFNKDIWLTPADGSAKPVNITQHPDSDYSPSFSADGKILAFHSDRVNNEHDVYFVYLDSKLENLIPKDLENYYKDAAKKAAKRKPLPVKPDKKNKPEENEKPDTKDKENKADKDKDKDAVKEGGDNKKDEDKEDAKQDDKDKQKKEDKPKEKTPLEVFNELDLADAYLRLKRITSSNGDEYDTLITPAGDRVIYRTSKGLYSVKYDGKDIKSIGPAASPMHVTLTGDKVIYVASSQAGYTNPASGGPKTVDISAQINIDLRAQSLQKFNQLSRTLGMMFYHPTMKGLNWSALTEQYAQLAQHARTGYEFEVIAERLMGELNGSHLGAYAPSETIPNTLPQGRLGIKTKRVPNGYEITEIFISARSSKGDMALQKGDIITHVELTPIKENDTLWSTLAGRIGKETIFTVERTNKDNPDMKTTLNLLHTPISSRDYRALAYKNIRQRNADLVEKWSDGKLGYIHIQSMNQASLDVYERDLYAAANGKKGLLIDVRNNGGGWTTDRLLSSIMAEPHAYTIPRGAPSDIKNGYPRDRLFIQRYTLPINMLCNEKSFSNAEIISHAFKTLKRGTLVGQETYGGVISTGSFTLIDGTRVRLPFRGWYLPDGTDMENNGAVPDLIVPQTPKAESNDNDEQLKAAVEDLLKRIK